MRVSIVTCVSTALDMLIFSTATAFGNAGIEDFDYVVVAWSPSEPVKRYLQALKGDSRMMVVDYVASPLQGYVANLRGMINVGLSCGFAINDYAGLINTDMYFGRGWLKNLVKHASEDVIVNSQHITPRTPGGHVIRADLGMTTFHEFNFAGFDRIYRDAYKDELQTEEQRGGWLNTNTLPYIFHKKWWAKYGPWDYECRAGTTEPPDRRFFRLCHEGGLRYVMAMDSICYHLEGGERFCYELPEEAKRIGMTRGVPGRVNGIRDGSGVASRSKLPEENIKRRRSR